MTADHAESLLQTQAADVGQAANAAAARMEEIRAIDQSALPDEEWLKLFREYATLSGTF